LQLTFLYALTLGLPDVANRSLWNDIAGMTFFSQVIMIILLFMSVISWAVMFLKYFRTKRVNIETDRFLREFRRQRNLNAYNDNSGHDARTPMVEMLRSAYDEIRNFTGLGRPRGGHSQLPITNGQLDLVADAIDRAGAEEIARLDSGIIILATTANAAPFLGLLGTVVGIYSAFKDIGAKGTATLGVVAPAIAEALIATAAGLAAAIPALIGYNYFTSRNRKMADRIDNFKSELFAAFKKEIMSVEEV
jgi:biopolymer transport protein TolQ